MNKKFMQKALDIAEKSGNDIPVGALIVKDGVVVSSAHNEKELLQDVTAHAEILAIRKASKELGSWRLNGCDLYVTLEPCPMCAWAAFQSRIDNIYFGSYDTVYGAFSTFKELYQKSNSKLNVKGGIMELECDNLLHKYFERMRE